MTYVPNPRDYQQLAEPITGRFDCTAYGAAFRADAHSLGAVRVSGRSVRLHSDEPVPDRDSPGLNLGQVDASLIDLTHGRVDLDTRVQSRSLTRVELRRRVVDGRFMGLSVDRGVLVRRGFVSGYTGPHDITVFTRDAEPDVPVMFDSLRTSLTRVSWDVVFDAAEALTPGHVYAQLTRDRSPDYRAVIKPDAGSSTIPFYQFHLDELGRIADTTRRYTGGIDRPCSRPVYHRSVIPGVAGRYLVQLLEGARVGWYVNGRFAVEVQP